MLSRAEIVVLGAELDALADRLLEEGPERRPLVQALWNLDAALERVDDDAFRWDHAEVLAQARAHLAGYFDA
jgi:hypothetical protein